MVCADLSSAADLVTWSASDPLVVWPGDLSRSPVSLTGAPFNFSATSSPLVSGIEMANPGDLVLFGKDNPGNFWKLVFYDQQSNAVYYSVPVDARAVGAGETVKQIAYHPATGTIFMVLNDAASTRYLVEIDRGGRLIGRWSQDEVMEGPGGSGTNTILGLMASGSSDSNVIGYDGDGAINRLRLWYLLDAAGGDRVAQVTLPR